MKYVLSLFMLLCSGAAFSQAGKPEMQHGASGTGRVFGKLADIAGLPLSKTSVYLLRVSNISGQTKQSLLQTTLTQENGDFDFENVPLTGSYILKINATGYLPLSQTVKIAPEDGMEKDLGTIHPAKNEQHLEAVVVTSAAPAMRLSADRKVFNVDKNIMSAGGTGVDVMRNVPSVDVDIDGNIKLRNSAPQLLVDGRPTTLTLDQIPADAIESVEVITNPSAKYDASGGGGGILNIVLKKNKKSGYNGNLRAGIDKRGALNGGADFNVRQNKLNFSASLNGHQENEHATGSTVRMSKLVTPETDISQQNLNTNKGAFLFAKAGLDYFVTNKTTLSLSGVRMHGQFTSHESINILTDSLYNTGTVSQNSDRLTLGSRQFDRSSVALGMKHTFDKKGEEWTLDANYYTGKNKNNANYTTDYFAGGAVDSVDLQRVIGTGNDKNYTIQTDYVLPFGKDGKFESGLRAAVRDRVNLSDNYTWDPGKSAYTLIPSNTSNYNSSDDVYAAYGAYSNSLHDLSYKLGVRAESSDYTATLTNTGEKFSHRYPISLFPSAFLSQKLNNKQELQFSYSRRINRPNFFQLIPFTDYTDKLNITRGNPDLVPEFTQSYEVSYLKTFSPGNNILASVYYKHTNDLITRYITPGTDPVTGSSELINTYINANSATAGGGELTSINTLAKWWDISTNVNLYRSAVNSSNSGSASQPGLWSWFGKFNSNFKLPANYSIQYTATYQSRSNLPVSNNGGGWMQQSQSASQGYIKASYGMDVAFKKSFLKNNAASVSLSITDILRTRVNSQYSNSDYFTQTYSRLRDPQMFRLNFSYRFGKQDALLFKRKSNGADPGADSGMGM